ncbi:hypothetical protein WG906_08775 [Pedobacter sp. P351]|uniref:hypothetical protein n=1 Tax=Pedobacter superstes TaxID=3133441 RepID=UPI0030B690E7
MNRLLLIIALCCASIGLSFESANAQYLQYEPIGPVLNKKLSDGWYKASVIYYNPKTYYKTKYTLKVKVSFNRVIEISFGNDGSVHAGYNNSGYNYIGGDLKYTHDSDGDIESATTQVNIVERDVSTKTFYISLE